MRPMKCLDYIATVQQEPFSSREAFEWLIDNACEADRRTWKYGRWVEIGRGQLGDTPMELAKHWGWNGPRRVLSYLKRLQRFGLIEIQYDGKALIVTIQGYDDLRRGEWPFPRRSEWGCQYGFEMPEREPPRLTLVHSV